VVAFPLTAASQVVLEVKWVRLHEGLPSAEQGVVTITDEAADW
jgi:hypothetical protein